MSTTMSCSLSQSYIQRTKEELLLEALTNISETLNVSIDFVIQPTGIFRYSDYGLPQTLFLNSSRLKEFDTFTFDANFGRGSRGNYHPDSGRIFLKQGLWCRHCVIHETLHSVSVFAHRQNIRIGNQYLFLREGLTEFLTGFVLWRRYSHCYNSWKSKVYPMRCAIVPDYEEMVRIWYTFCRFVDFENVKSLFFADGTTNWSDLWSSFLDAIHEVGYRQFRDPIPGNIGHIQYRFLEECKSRFGRGEVERILEIESPNLEYETLESGINT